MTVTDEMVRRFPYAVNPIRITAALEEAIAHDMLVAARKEGHGPATRNPASWRPQE